MVNFSPNNVPHQDRLSPAVEAALAQVVGGLNTRLCADLSELVCVFEAVNEHACTDLEKRISRSLICSLLQFQNLLFCVGELLYQSVGLKAELQEIVLRIEQLLVDFGDGRRELIEIANANRRLADLARLDLYREAVKKGIASAPQKTQVSLRVSIDFLPMTDINALAAGTDVLLLMRDPWQGYDEILNVRFDGEYFFYKGRKVMPISAIAGWALLPYKLPYRSNDPRLVSK